MRRLSYLFGVWFWKLIFQIWLKFKLEEEKGCLESFFPWFYWIIISLCNRLKSIYLPSSCNWFKILSKYQTKLLESWFSGELFSNKTRIPCSNFPSSDRFFFHISFTWISRNRFSRSVFGHLLLQFIVKCGTKTNQKSYFKRWSLLLICPVAKVLHLESHDCFNWRRFKQIIMT